MIVTTPSNEVETRLLLTSAFNFDGPATVRYPRGSGPNKTFEESLNEIPIGKANLIREGDKKSIMLNFGALLHEAEKVSESLNLTLIDMRFVKPLDEDILKNHLKQADLVVTLEDGCIAGGAGSAVQEFCSKQSFNPRFLILGIPDSFIEHASRDEMLEECGLTASKIENKVLKMME